MASYPHEPDRQRRRWAWRLGSLAGISIYVHATFVLLLAWIAMVHLTAGHDLELMMQGLLLVVCVFTVVVLHELGHALMARRFGAATRDITLYPIGGIARLERIPERRRRSCSSRSPALPSTGSSRSRSTSGCAWVRWPPTGIP